jgi:hypothetical protein
VPDVKIYRKSWSDVFAEIALRNTFASLCEIEMIDPWVFMLALELAFPFGEPYFTQYGIIRIRA